jgi:hypothetical protein
LGDLGEKKNQWDNLENPQKESNGFLTKAQEQLSGGSECFPISREIGKQQQTTQPKSHHRKINSGT